MWGEKTIPRCHPPGPDASGPLNATVTTIARGCNVPPTANPTFCPPGRVQAAAPRCFSHRAIDGPFSKAARSLCKSPWRYSFSSQLLWCDSGCTHYTPGHWFVKRKSGIFSNFLSYGRVLHSARPCRVTCWSGAAGGGGPAAGAGSRTPDNTAQQPAKTPPKRPQMSAASRTE